jgi:cytochrome c-type biogenesis protein CcmF
MVASGIVWMAFFASVVATYAYFQTASKKKNLTTLARRSFLAMAAGVLAASVLLMMFILRHQFEYAYVWGYSSLELPTHLLVTTFWAGQEGSFMFWTLCSMLIGFALLNYSRNMRIESETMAVYSLLQSFLLLLLIAKSPFKYIWDEFPGQVASGSIPVDGKGLNPLLQNFWMIIHPPVLFIGFAAMAVPFSLAVAGLWRRAYSEWIPTALPWLYFAAISLGAGLILGGYWAYGVLGWGGWWGWDPVENSSLVPWIVAVTLIHTLLVQKKTGKLIRTNFILALTAFLLVIYSTFLTRSGVLGDSSVHSFVDPGALAYALLVLWLVTVAAIGFGLLFRRRKELRSLAESVGMMTRESMISIGAAAMGASALIILFGTSWPLVANSTVEPSFYDSMNLPIAALMGLVLGISLLVQWRMESRAGVVRRSLLSLVFALAATTALFLAGVKDFSMLVLSAASFFALAVNLKRGYQLGKQSPALLGGVLSHVGLAMLFLAIIASGRYGTKKTQSLPLNQPQDLLGYSATYTGSRTIEGNKHEFAVKIERDGKSFFLYPVMYEASYNNSIMREPDYTSSLWGDFYLEPVSLEAQAAGPKEKHVLIKGTPVTIGGRSVTFLRFDMSHEGVTGMTSGGGFPIDVVLEIRQGKKKEELTLRSEFNQGIAHPTSSTTKDGALTLSFISMNVDTETKKSSIELGVSDPGVVATPSRPELLVVEASSKPFMNFVWVAAIFLLGGVGLALYNNSRNTVLPIQRQKTNGKKGETVTVQKEEATYVEQT